MPGPVASRVGSAPRAPPSRTVRRSGPWSWRTRPGRAWTRRPGSCGPRGTASTATSPVLIGTSLPFLLGPGLHHAEAFGEALAEGAWGPRAKKVGEGLRQGADLEHWAAFQDGFQKVSEMTLEVARGRRGHPPGTITFLSGDVHHSFVNEARPTPEEFQERGPIHSRDHPGRVLADPQSDAPAAAVPGGGAGLRRRRAARPRRGPLRQGPGRAAHSGAFSRARGSTTTSPPWRWTAADSDCGGRPAWWRAASTTVRGSRGCPR